jgi:hypothetical protein
MNEMTKLKRNYSLVRKGLKINRLSFCEIVMVGNKTYSKWVCDCGKIITVRPISVFNHNTKSCGCLQREKVGLMARKHGKTKLPVYKIWKGMKNRCYNKNNSEFKNYGARGIQVCDRWHDFEKFLEDMPGFEKGLSIERLDVKKGYSPENCKWIEHRLQGKNTRLTKMNYDKAQEAIHLRSNGLTYKQIAKNFGVGKSCINHILNKRSWNE